MKLTEVKDLPTDYKIYVDLDGVLVDFRKKQMEVTGIPGSLDTMEKKLKRTFWYKVSQYEKNGGKFWGEMDPMPDAFDLWNYVAKYTPTVLTASGTTGDAPAEKRVWVAKHLDLPESRIIVVEASRDKSKHAAPNHILIDDSSRAIDPWIAAGGIGVLHTSAANSIAKLKELGL